MYDAIVIGAGPAGLNAGLYLSRSGYTTLLLEGSFAGGQVSTTFEVDNYLGFDQTIDGAALVEHMTAHAQKFGAELKREKVTAASLAGEVKTVTTRKGVYEAKTVVLAPGSKPRLLGVPGEDTLRGLGVSYCATCDGAFFKGKTVCVIGGGDTALEDALFLEKYCQQVYLIHRRDTYRAVKALTDRVTASSVIHPLYNSVVTAILGEETVTKVSVSEQGNPPYELPCDGVFVAVGTTPQTQFLSGQLPLADNGYIPTDERMATDIPGVFAAGDARQKPLRQIITAAADGAVAAYSAALYLVDNAR